MQQAVREGGVEHHSEPVHRHHLAVDNLIALRGLHPAIRREDPEGGDNSPQRHHAGGEEVQSRSDFLPAEQHHAEETGLKEEGGKHFVGQEWAGNTARKL